MSQVQAIDSSGSATPAAAVQSTAVSPSTAGQVASANASATDSNTTISSLEDLRKKSPKVYKLMIESLGRQICSEMKKHSDKLKKMMSS